MADVITTVGKNHVAEKIGGIGAVADFTYLAVGTDTGTAAVGDTTLGSEITGGNLARVTSTVTTTTANILQLQHTWTASASKAITECGVLNAASAGELLARSDFSAINVDSGDSIQIGELISWSAISAMIWNVFGETRNILYAIGRTISCEAIV